MPDSARPKPIGGAEAPPAPPCTLVIFGGGGDLTKRLLMPAIYNLARQKLLDPSFAIVGVDRVERTDDDFRDSLIGAIREFGKANDEALDEAALAWLGSRLRFRQGDLNDPEAYVRLGQKLDEIGGSAGSGNVVFYLAVAARFFGPVVEHLGASGLANESERGWRRVIIEKPFGHDLPSARELDAQILKVLDESQIYRMDHFLGKETVQNIMALRFANGIFEPLWSRLHIDHVQITASETVSVGTRGSFYEQTGALRDMVPNHLFQLLAMTAMEAPNSFDPDAVRDEKAKVIEAIHPYTLDEALANTVRGQYSAGTIGDTSVKAYHAEDSVAPDSTTETFVAIKLAIDNWRWAGVPFYLRTGKAMTTRRTEIGIRFKQAPYALFRDTPVEQLGPNVMVLRVQPNEGLSLQFDAKVPGPTVKLAPVKMDFRYDDYFEHAPSTGYETLIYDCLTGDATLFQRADNIEAGWAGVQPILDAWATGRSHTHDYAAGSSGPAEADSLLARDGRSWIPLT